jgi:hypothetical protein
MERKLSRIAGFVESAQQALQAIAARCPQDIATAVERARSDAGAILHHCAQSTRHSRLFVILGGTGTGKSSLVNRLLDDRVVASSFRRTFTEGVIIVCRGAEAVPPGWMGLPHRSPSPGDGPAKGTPGEVTVTAHAHPLLETVSLVDTPDLDGDKPMHHEQADRAFRWADAVILLVSPEKYQMPELVPYHRMARRYGIPVVHVMNKAEHPRVVEDHLRQLTERGEANATVFVIGRDDSGFAPAPTVGLGALKEALLAPHSPPLPAASSGIRNRAEDWTVRVSDTVVGPLRKLLRDADDLVSRLRGLEAVPAGVDVHPVADALQRRFRERSILYLMGPMRILDRVRQLPGALARLPRTAVDVLRGTPRGKTAADTAKPPPEPDFRQIAVEQFRAFNNRIDDLCRSSAAGRLAIDSGALSRSLLPEESAGRIVDEELGAFRSWLNEKWDATPRDTVMIQKLLKLIPGASRLPQYSEAAPYLLAIVVAAHHAFFGPVDLAILGAYSFVTWLGERAGNEVGARTRATNARISERFLDLVHRQVEAATGAVRGVLPDARDLARLEELLDGAPIDSDASKEARP